jgi:hypothetical protein
VAAGELAKLSDVPPLWGLAGAAALTMSQRGGAGAGGACADMGGTRVASGVRGADQTTIDALRAKVIGALYEAGQVYLRPFHPPGYGAEVRVRIPHVVPSNVSPSLSHTHLFSPDTVTPLTTDADRFLTPLA